MKMLLILSTLMFGQVAMADDFSCTLKIGNFNSVSAMADYRGRSVVIESGDYKCVATIDPNIMVTTVVESRSSGQLETKSASGKGNAEVEITTLDQHGDGLNVVKCDCGLI